VHRKRGVYILSVLKQVESVASSPPAGVAVKNRHSQQYRHAHSRNHRMKEAQAEAASKFTS
jgi:hypothetical protein